MSIHPGCRTSARFALRVGAALVVLAGLFGMHGLDTHGTAGMGPMPAAAMNEPASHSVGAADPSLPALAHDAGFAVVAAAARIERLAMDMGMKGMCLAILAFALVGLLSVLLSNRVFPVRSVLPRQPRAPGRPGRDPDPPSLIRLSIQRC